MLLTAYLLIYEKELDAKKGLIDGASVNINEIKAIAGIFQQKFLKIRELISFVNASNEFKLEKLEELAQKTQKKGQQLEIVKKLAAGQSKKTTQDSTKTTKMEIEEAFKIPASEISVPKRNEWDEEDDD
ncbi:hypothetical protein niasHT_011973 [Heterodera trifolii]|uniref:Uncharacterized protein n=1 Tax=Heterodera trifolii TaxID=157864 RepID=A0ABD2LKC5_9BILA